MGVTGGPARSMLPPGFRPMRPSELWDWHPYTDLPTAYGWSLAFTEPWNRSVPCPDFFDDGTCDFCEEVFLAADLTVVR